MWRKIQFILPLLLALLIAGAVVVLKSMDFNAYRDQLSAEVRKATGRQFSIDGDLGLAFSFDPTLTVNDVRFGNASWGKQQDMLKAGRLEAKVGILPLLLGEIRIRRLVLIDTDLMLETQPTGRGNWELGLEAQASKEEIPAQGGELLPTLESIEMRNLEVAFHDGAVGKATVLHLDRLIARAQTPFMPLSLEMRGRLDKEAFRISGKVSSFQEMISGDPLKLNLIAEAGGTRLKANGIVAKPAVGEGIDLRVYADGSDLAMLSSLVGVKLPPIKPWQASFSLMGERFDLQFSDIKLLLNGSDVRGNLLLKLRQGRVPFVKAELDSRYFDLAALRGRKTKAKKQGKKEKDKIFSSESMTFDGLKALDAVVALRADQFVTEKLEITKLDAGLRLSGGVLAIKPFQAGVVDGTAKGELVLNAAATPASLALNLKGKGLDLGRLLRVSGNKETITGKGDLVLNLEGQGNSIAAVMGSLDGYTRLLVGKGTLEAGSMDSLVGGLSKAMGTMVAKKRDRATMNCLASDFEIMKGVATSRALLVDTEYSTVFGEGDINLRQETLDLLLIPKPKSVTLNVAVPVQVRGTLANPAFAAEKVAVMRKAAGLLAVVGGLAFPPVALLSLGELGTGEENPCLRIAQVGDDRVLAQQSEEKQKDQADQKNQKEGGIKGVLKKWGNKLRGLFGD